MSENISQENHAYRCQFCLLWSDKNNWGPGRIWCPNCKGQQLSPAEIIEHCEDFGPMIPLKPNKYYNE